MDFLLSTKEEYLLVNEIGSEVKPILAFSILLFLSGSYLYSNQWSSFSLFLLTISSHPHPLSALHQTQTAVGKLPLGTAALPWSHAAKEEGAPWSPLLGNLLFRL